MSDLKAAIARAKANGPRKVDVHQDHLTGKTVSKRSKTGNPACSAAMSAWKLGRGTPEVHAMLARCRAMAAGRRQAELSRAAGNEARAQHLEHRSKQGLTGKDRLAKARELAEKRKAGRTPAEKPAPAPESAKTNVRNMAGAFRVSRQSIMANRQHRVGPGDGRTIEDQNKDSRLGNTKRIVDRMLGGGAKPEYALRRDVLERAKGRLEKLSRLRAEALRERDKAARKEYVAKVYRKTAGIADDPPKPIPPPPRADAPEKRKTSRQRAREILQQMGRNPQRGSDWRRRLADDLRQIRTAPIADAAKRAGGIVNKYPGGGVGAGQGIAIKPNENTPWYVYNRREAARMAQSRAYASLADLADYVRTKGRK